MHLLSDSYEFRKSRNELLYDLQHLASSVHFLFSCFSRQWFLVAAFCTTSRTCFKMTRQDNMEMASLLHDITTHIYILFHDTVKHRK